MNERDDEESLCPITLGKIRHGVQLRNVWFESEAVIEMLISGQTRHPYDRKLLTETDLSAIHARCMCDDGLTARLSEMGWTDVDRFVAELSDCGRRQNVIPIVVDMHREGRARWQDFRCCTTTLMYTLCILSIVFLAVLVVS